jgi:hypothetical protein
LTHALTQHPSSCVPSSPPPAAPAADAERDRELKLYVSGKTLAPGSLRNPVVGIANYVFDTLRHDAFRLVEGQLQEATVALYTEGGAPAAAPAAGDGAGAAAAPATAPAPGAAAAAIGDPDTIKRLRCVWDYRLCSPEIYRNPHLQTMLRAYAARLRNASLLVPIGGITCLANLAALSGGRLLMLAGDKAYNHEVSAAGGAKGANGVGERRGGGQRLGWRELQLVAMLTSSPTPPPPPPTHPPTLTTPLPRRRSWWACATRTWRCTAASR